MTDRFKEILSYPPASMPRSEMRPIIELLLQAEESLQIYSEGGNFTGEEAMESLQAIDKFRKGER